MKYITLPLLVFSLSAPGQPLTVNPETKLVTFESIQEIEGTTADKLFDKSKGWIVEYFRDSKEIIRGESRPDLIKGAIILRCEGNYVKEYAADLTLRFKDGKVKITIDHLKDAQPNPNAGEALTVESWGVKSDGTMRPSMAKQFEMIQLACNSMASNLLAYMQKKKDDW